MVGDKIVNEEDDGEVLPLPGFRFHPTDEELVGFYLWRKVQKKAIKMDIIKHVDIYKFDPWDLPRWSNTEKESYFFCKRGRKYRNSIRPNRVTGSGFWKATGIDKPVYSEGHNSSSAAGGGMDMMMGLKKTLVYYRGSAGKGTKTEWMMHEFRLPSHTTTHDIHVPNSILHSSPQEDAEVWTLCRIFKRNVSSRKYSGEWREVAATSSKRVKPHTTSNVNVVSQSHHQEAYINFGVHAHYCTNAIQMSSTPHDDTQAPAGPLHEFSNVVEDLSYGNWDELRSIVDFAFAPSSLY